MDSYVCLYEKRKDKIKKICESINLLPICPEAKCEELYGKKKNHIIKNPIENPVLSH